jgi:serine/threonine protein kinase
VIAAGGSIGNYRVLNKIGTGGMGAVYLAEHPLIGKRVALKVIHRELANNRDVVSRFFQEARAVNKIGNEHIVEIHDFGVTPEGDHFFIMEYLEGKTLAAVLSREGALGIVRSLHIGGQIANALAAAHAAGIVHRDLKPDNIMLLSRLGDQDFVKVLDFGLAKVFSAATAVKTAAGVLLGTPQYMSPEACESKGDVDHRTDIYALGVLMFQMMTGVLPFDGDSMGEVLVKQVTVLPPAPRALNPAIPPSVEQILLRCLAKPLDARFATMLELREALLDPEAYLRGSPPIAPARSVGPGEALIDSKTAMLHAAQQQKSWLAPAAASQHTRIAPPHALPLPPPAVSLSGGSAAPTIIAGQAHAASKPVATGMLALAQPPELKMNTMRIATPIGYSSRGPRKVWPVVLMMALLLGLAGGAFVVLWFGPGNTPATTESSVDEGAAGGNSAASGTGSAAAAAATGSADTSAAAGGGSGATSASTSGGGAATPASAGGGSVAIGTTAGAGRPALDTGAGSGTGPIAEGPGGAAITASTGPGSEIIATRSGSPPGGAATATSGTKSMAPGTEPATASGRAPSSTASTVALAASGTASTAHLSIDSAPPGAAVTGPSGEALGKTPLKIEWPISDLPVAFELRLGGYKRKLKQTVVNGNTALRVELERAPVVRRNSGSAKAGSAADALMPP